MRISIYEKLERDRVETRRARLDAERKLYELASLRDQCASLRVDLALIKLRYALRRKYRPDQPRVPAGNPDGGQWTSEAGSGADGTVDVDVTGSTEEQPSRSNPQDIIARARRLNIAARSDAYQRCLDLCYPLLERPQRSGSDRNQWDFHKCMNACLRRNLE